MKVLECLIIILAILQLLIHIESNKNFLKINPVHNIRSGQEDTIVNIRSVEDGDKQDPNTNSTGPESNSTTPVTTKKDKKSHTLYLIIICASLLTIFCVIGILGLSYLGHSLKARKSGVDLRDGSQMSTGISDGLGSTVVSKASVQSNVESSIKSTKDNRTKFETAKGNKEIVRKAS